MYELRVRMWYEMVTAASYCYIVERHIAGTMFAVFLHLRYYVNVVVNQILYINLMFADINSISILPNWSTRNAVKLLFSLRSLKLTIPSESCSYAHELLSQQFVNFFYLLFGILLSVRASCHVLFK